MAERSGPKLQISEKSPWQYMLPLDFGDGDNLPLLEEELQPSDETQKSNVVPPDSAEIARLLAEDRADRESLYRR